MCAAALTCGMAFTSCAKMDYPTGPEYFWEKTTNVIDFEDGTTPFTGDSRITVGVGTVSGWDSQVATFKGAGNAQNGYSFAHYDFSSKVEKAQKVKISFDYYNANSRAIVTVGDALVRGADGGSTKTTYNGKGGVFRIGSDKSNFFINGTTMGAKKNQVRGEEAVISADDSKVKVVVIPTDEELMIATDTMNLL